MEYTEIQDELLAILEEKRGIYRTAYQICKKLEVSYPVLWTQLLRSYPVEAGAPQMGAGAGIYYSIANFTALALDNLANRNGSVIRKAWIDSKNTIFEGVEPGYKEKTSIWMVE